MLLNPTAGGHACQVDTGGAATTTTTAAATTAATIDLQKIRDILYMHENNKPQQVL